LRFRQVVAILIPPTSPAALRAARAASRFTVRCVMLTNPSMTNDLTSAIIGGAIKVHRAVGPGLLESAYLPCLELELKELDFRVELRKPVPLIYRGLKLDACYWLDMLVNGTVVVEIKSVSAIAPIHEAQLLTYFSCAALLVS